MEYTPCKPSRIPFIELSITEMDPETGLLQFGQDVSELPASKHRQPSPLEEFAQSLAYSGVQAPLSSVGQLTGIPVPKLLAAPQEAEFASLNWYAQQFGGAIGAIPSFVAVHKGVGKLTGPFSSPIRKAAISGILYEGLLRPVDDTLSAAEMVKVRGHNAIAGGLTFGAMAGISDVCRPLTLANHGKAPVAQAITEYTKNLGSTISRGVAAGAGGGLVNAQYHAFSEGHWVADSKDYLRSAYSFAVIGAGLEALGAHKQQAPDPAKLENGVTIKDGRYYAESGSLVYRVDGRLEAYQRGKTVELLRGDSVLKPQELTVRGYGLEFRHNGLSFLTTASGRIKSIREHATGTTTKVSYSHGSDISAPRIKSVITRDANGIASSNFWINYHPSIGQYCNHARLGTEARINLDGSIKITGAAADGTSGVGSTLYSSRALTFDSITLKRDGTEIWQFGKNRELTKNREGKVLGVQSGPDKTEYGYDSAGQLASLTFNGERQLRLKDNLWVDSTGQAIATEIKIGPIGCLQIRPDSTFRLPRFPDTRISSISYHPGVNQTYYKFPLQARAPLDARPLERPVTSRESLATKIATKEAKALDGGFYVIQKPTGESIRLNGEGQVVSIKDRSGMIIDIKRSEHGTLESVEFSRNGKIERTLTNNGKEWEVRSADGQVYGRRRQVTIDLDGSITELNYSSEHTLDWTGTKVRPDGLRIHIDKIGRERISGADLKIERTRVLDLVRSLSGNPEAISRFENWMDTFEARAKKRTPPLSADELANTYYHLDKLLSSDLSVLGQGQRLSLAEQFMFKAAYPHTITQGQFRTCNVTAAIEQRFVTKFPSAAIRMVSDAAVTGRVILTDGTILDMTQIKNVLVPFNTKTPTFDPVTFDSSRDFFDQLSQSIAVNAHWQSPSASSGKAATSIFDERLGKPFRPGDLRYELTDRYRHSELINDYGMTPPARFIIPEYKTGTDPFSGIKQTILTPAPAEQPDIRIQNFKAIEMQLLGYNDKPHNLSTTRSGEKGATLVGTARELRDVLLKMKTQGALPATVTVNGGSQLMGARAGRTHTSHVVNVQDIHLVNGQWRVEMTNQWGSQWNHLGTKDAITIDALWEGMRGYENKVPIDEPTTRKPVDWRLIGGAEAMLMLGLHARQKFSEELEI